MRYYIYILSAALSVAIMSGCSKNEPAEKQQVGSSLRGDHVPEGWFVATFSTSVTRAEADFDSITGEDPRVKDLRYLIYDADGNFVKERLIFDDFDEDTDDEQDWPLPSITDTLPVGEYTAVFVTNTDPDMFQREVENMIMPEDLLTDYMLGFDEARLNLPYLLGADDADFFMDVIEFSNTDADETVYLQRVVGIFKAYRTLVDVQEALNGLVADLVDSVAMKSLIGDQVLPYLQDNLSGGLVGGVLTRVLGGIPLPLDRVVGLLVGVILDPLLDALLDPLVDVLYDYLLKALVDEVGGILEANNNSDLKVLDILDPLLNPWKFTDYAAVSVSNQPTQFGFDMEVKARDPNPRTYLLPIVDTVSDGETKRVVITKYLGFEDIDNDGIGEELMTLNSINAATEGVIGGLLDGLVESDYLLDGALFDIEDPLKFHAPGNLQVYNEYSVADLGIDDSVQKETQDLTISLEALDPADLKNALGSVLDGVLNGITIDPLGALGPDYSLNDLLGLVGASLDFLTDDLLTALIGNGLDVDGALTNLSITVPVSLPLLNLSDLNVSGGWDPVNTLEVPE